MPLRLRPLFPVTIGAIVLACSTPTSVRADPSPTPPTAPRVVAIGDLHGDLEQALAVLRLAGLVDAEGRWSGGDAVLVQTGDLVDRGPQSREVIDLVRRLVDEAAAAGGRVEPLLGNHETMNLLGDWRYVSPDDVAGFGGLDARLAAFRLDGAYGAWLADRDVVTRVGDTVFAHGGVTPEWATRGIDPINDAARAALRGGDPDVLGTNGPLWYRGYALDDESTACPRLARALDALGAARMVVGHTTQRSGRVATRCDGRLALVDVGIARHYGGHLAAWERVDTDARVLTPEGPIDLPDP